MNQLLVNKKIEGYWYSDDPVNKDYPMPIPNVIDQEQAEKIYSLILTKECEAYCINYKGLSQSRITNEFVGCSEYHHPSGWVWPTALPRHYVLKHKVKPSDEFLKFIGYIQ